MIHNYFNKSVNIIFKNKVSKNQIYKPYLISKKNNYR